MLLKMVKLVEFLVVLENSLDSPASLLVLASFPCHATLRFPSSEGQYSLSLHLSPAKRTLRICSDKLASFELLMTENKTSLVAPSSCCHGSVTIPLPPNAWPLPVTRELSSGQEVWH